MGPYALSLLFRVLLLISSAIGSKIVLGGWFSIAEHHREVPKLVEDRQYQPAAEAHREILSANQSRGMAELAHLRREVQPSFSSLESAW